MTLLERLEAATEGSRELDVEVAKYFGGAVRWSTGKPGEGMRYQVLWEFDEAPAQGSDIDRLPDLPNLTTSIDAALALVERVRPGSEWDLTNIYGGSAKFNEQIRFSMDLNSDYPIYESACTIPLAICLALVKAEGE